MHEKITESYFLLTYTNKWKSCVAVCVLPLKIWGHKADTVETSALYRVPVVPGSVERDPFPYQGIEIEVEILVNHVKRCDND